MDDGDESGALRAEDLEVRVDLRDDDLLHMVFSFLDPSNLCRAAMVCRHWRLASAHEDFWRCLHFENRNISAEQCLQFWRVGMDSDTPYLDKYLAVKDMCRRHPDATELIIIGIPNLHLLVMEVATFFRNLVSLTLGEGLLLDSLFPILANCNTLKSLNVNDATLGNGREISINHDQLHHLKLTRCRVMRISIRCPQLKDLSLKRSNMAQAALNCPLLCLLDIGACHKFSDAAIRTAATSCPQLESLDMTNCSRVSDETLCEIARTCASLNVLNASYCPNISLESVRLPMLTVLKVESCEGITSASVAAISHCYMLKKLALRKLENLTTLELQCQSLQEVDLSDCESLTNSICEVFGNGGGCPMVKSLVLDNCKSLTETHFSSMSLENLSLVGCRDITTLELACPCLEKVCLDGCEHLETASFSPVALQSLDLGICAKLNKLTIDAPSMVSLDLKGCYNLSEFSINSPHLISLDASFCSQLKDSLSEAIALRSLKSLLSGRASRRHQGCSQRRQYLTAVDLVSAFRTSWRHEVLKLLACKYLADVSLGPLYKEDALPALQELDLSYGNLCVSAIVELLAYCTHLTHVSLNGCVNMHDLNWGSTGVNFMSRLILACFLR